MKTYLVICDNFEQFRVYVQIRHQRDGLRLTKFSTHQKYAIMAGNKYVFVRADQPDRLKGTRPDGIDVCQPILGRVRPKELTQEIHFAKLSKPGCEVRHFHT